MTQPTIVVENLGKRYKIGRPVRPGTTRAARLRNVLAAHLNRLRILSERGANHEFIWALQDIGFTITPGEVVGFIGRNGAGKSTLLKILSRIVTPTTGRATIHGRVGSLLEVGTGFHPELTGRENIYLNGAILGMRRVEIDRVFDAIVAFSEIERFLDTPVKRYSSGMYVRLAFSVAAHLEPEILLVDEVLAVGDVAFQKKCLGKTGDIAATGRTVLFVSHNMATVEGLCRRGIVLDQGRIVCDGPIDEAIRHYLAGVHSHTETELRTRTGRRGTGRLRLTGMALRTADGALTDGFTTGHPATLELEYESTAPDALSVDLRVSIDNNTGQRLVNPTSDVTGQPLSHVPPGRGVFRIHLDRMPLLPGRYYFHVMVATHSGEVLDHVDEAGYFDVTPGDFYGTGKLPPSGQLCLDAKFSVREGTPATPTPLAAHS